VFKEVDRIVIEATDLKGFHFDRDSMTVDQILGWLSPAFLNGQIRNFAAERAEQWVHPAKIVAHRHDPIDWTLSLCGIRAGQLASHRTPEACHRLIRGPLPDDVEICKECASRQDERADP
jgi:hypothetical protein